MAMDMSLPNTVLGRLLGWAREDTRRPAFIFRGSQPGNQRLKLSRGLVYELAMAFGDVLRTVGVQPGMVVCNTLPNSPERLITDLGCMLLGATTLNGMLHLADGSDLVQMLTKGRVTAIVLDPTAHPNALDVLGDRVIVRGEHARSGLVPDLKKVINVNCGGGSGLRPWLDQLSQRRDDMEDHGELSLVNPHDVAILFNAAGATAFSCLVPKTHEQLIQMGCTLTDVAGINTSDNFYNDRSLGWYNGCCCDYLARGSTRVLVDMTAPPSDPLAFSWEACLAENCCVRFMQCPDLSRSMSRSQLWAGHKNKPRTIVTGGMPMTRQQVTGVGSMCHTLVIIQGSAEAGFMTYHRLYKRRRHQFLDGDYGIPTKDSIVRLVNKEGAEIPPKEHVGEPGELELWGPQVSVGEASHVTEDGWVRTGEVAMYNTHGHLQAVCLSFPAIIHGPYVIFYGWLERRMLECPGVQKVIIVPVPDHLMFQEMCACVVPDRDTVLEDAELRSFCQALFVRDAPLECQQIPKYFLFLQEFPKKEGETEPDRSMLFYKVLEILRMNPTAH